MAEINVLLQERLSQAAWHMWMIAVVLSPGCDRYIRRQAAAMKPMCKCTRGGAHARYTQMRARAQPGCVSYPSRPDSFIEYHNHIQYLCRYAAHIYSVYTCSTPHTTLTCVRLADTTRYTPAASMLPARAGGGGGTACTLQHRNNMRGWLGRFQHCGPLLQG